MGNSTVKAFVTGAAGFIGSNLVAELLARGCEVAGLDNFHLGSKRFLEPFVGHPGFTFYEKDLLEFDGLPASLAGSDVVFHLAANSDISQGTARTDTDLKLGTIATYNVLEAMRIAGVPRIVFASTSAVYGEPRRFPTPEDYGPLLPVSLYGASKLACEGLVAAFSNTFSIQAWIFRFANVVGKNGTHGALVDFIRSLRNDPRRLTVRGDGTQTKPYLHVSECIDGMLFALEHAPERINVYNLTSEGTTSVASIARMVIEEMGLQGVDLSYTGGPRGWPGDVPFVDLDSTRMKSLGWTARYRSDDAVRAALRELLQQY